MKEKTKKTLAMIALAGASFGAGVYFSADANMLRSYTNYETQKGFYQTPYDLRVQTLTNKDGKVEVYLKDAKTNKSHKIGLNMYVGDANHNAEGALFELFSPLHDYNVK